MFNATDKERGNCLIIAPIPLFSSRLDQVWHILLQNILLKKEEISYQRKAFISVSLIEGGFWYLMPLSTIFQLYCGVSFIEGNHSNSDYKITTSPGISWTL